MAWNLFILSIVRAYTYFCFFCTVHCALDKKVVSLSSYKS